MERAKGTYLAAKYQRLVKRKAEIWKAQISKRYGPISIKPLNLAPSSISSDEASEPRAQPNDSSVAPAPVLPCRRSPEVSLRVAGWSVSQRTARARVSQGSLLPLPSGET